MNHVEGHQNILYDMLNRLVEGYRVQSLKTGNICALMIENEQVTSTSQTIDWPEWFEFSDEQAAGTNIQETENKDLNNVLKCGDCVWIPDYAHELQTKIIVTAHSGWMGHRVMDGTESIIWENFSWPNLTTNVQKFVKDCIHCIISRNGENSPRPLGEALHVRKSNQVVHCDFLYMGTAADSYLKYILIIKDDSVQHAQH